MTNKFTLRKLTALVSLFVLLTVGGNAWGQVPNDYYDQATGLTGAVLKQKLHDITTNGHTTLSYTYLWTAFQSTDRDDNSLYENDNSVFDKYSENPAGADNYNFSYTSDQCGTSGPEGTCYNREHSFPKSWWGGAESGDKYTDLNHLIPTDSWVNMKRANYPFGEVGGTPSFTSQNGSLLGTSSYSGISGTVFEPIDDFKGDFARMLFYMATRYKDEIPGWVTAYSSSGIGTVFQTNGEFQTSYYEMLYNWHSDDPVSQKERDRNDDVYNEQGNANPYIDHPEWVCEVFGACVIKPEPSEYVTNFQAAAVSASQIDLSWTEAAGTNLPDGYYIPANTTGTFTNPVEDGTQPTEDNDLSDGSAMAKVSYGGKGSLSFTGLNAATQYYFKVFPYTNSGSNIDFKTDGTPPEANDITDAKATTIIAIQDFDGTTPNWSYSGSGSLGGSYGKTSNGYRIGGSTSISMNTVDVTGYSSLKLYISDASVGGIENSDALEIYVNIDGGGFPATPDVTIQEGNPSDGIYNRTWAYTATNTAVTTAGTPITVYGDGTSGYANVEISIPNGTTSVAVNIVSNNNNTSEYYYLDDIKIEGELSGPSLSVSSLTAFGDVCTGSTAGPNSFTITGSDLTTANVTVSSLSGYTFCTTSGGTYTKSLDLTQSGGAYSQDIYVKFSPVAVQSYDGNIVVGGGGATSVNCAASGSGITVPGTPNCSTPASEEEGTAVTITGAGSANATNYTYWDASSGGNEYTDGVGGYSISSGNLTTPTSLTPGTYNYYVQGENSCGSSAARQLVQVTITAAPVTINAENFDYADCGSFTWTPYDVAGDDYWICVDATDDYVEMNGYDGTTDEDWLISPALNLDSYDNEILTFETAKDYSGDDIQLLYSADYNGSSDPSTQGTWNSLTFTKASGTSFVSSGDVDLSGITGTAVYLAFKYTMPSSAELWRVDNILITGVLSAVCETPTTQATALDLNDNTTFSSIDGSFTAASGSPDGYLVVRSLNNTLTDPTDLPSDETSYTPGQTIGDGTVVSVGSSTSFTASGLTASTQYFFFVFSYNNAACSGGPKYNTTSPLIGNETTAAGPSLTVSTTSLTDFGNVCVGTLSSNETFTVEGSNLIADLVVTAPSEFQVSLASGSGFGSSVTISPTGGTVSTTTIYAKLVPSSAGAKSGNIEVTSTSAATKTVSVSGTGVAVPTITGTTPGSVCVSGTVNLEATASAGTINWYTVETGGTSQGTGGSFTTPSISSTTSYWVDATDNGCTTSTRTEIVATVYGVVDVTSPSATAGNTQADISWTNPPCYDEILVVCAPASNTGTPSGDGSSYTGNLNYTSGTALGNGYAVYKGSTSPQTITGLTNGTTYYIKFFTRLGTTWSSGTEIQVTPVATVFNIIDDYDGVDDKSYAMEGTGEWSIVSEEYRNDNSGDLPNHSYASYDLSGTMSNWQLNKAYKNTWCGWIDFNNSSISGWGVSNNSIGMVLAANNADFNNTLVEGYAVVFSNNSDHLELIKFSDGIHGGSQALPQGSTSLIETSYVFNSSADGLSIYVEYLSDGTWKLYWIEGKLTPAQAQDKGNYTGGNQTSASADETYSGTSYKYTGWVHAHSSSSSQYAYYDNLGAGMTPPAAVLVVDPSSITGLDYDYYVGGPSASDNFDLSGSSLDGSDVTVTAPTNFQVSTDNTNFSNSLTLSSYDGTSTTIYVRLIASLNTGSYSGDVTIAGGGAAEKTVSLSGKVTKTDPSENPSGFTCTVTGQTTMTLDWTAAGGSVVPDGYLIKWNSTGYSTNTEPVDGTPEADGAGVKNITFGTNTYDVTGLTAGVSYYYAIWSYTNSGSDIKYKQVAPSDPPQTNCTTYSAPCASTSFEESGYDGFSLDGASMATHTASAYDGDDRIIMNAVDEIIYSPELTSPSDLSFYARLNASSDVLTLEIAYSDTKYGTYTVITTFDESDFSTTYQEKTVNLNLSSTKYIRWRISSVTTGDQLWVDLVNIYCNTTTPNVAITTPTISAGNVEQNTNKHTLYKFTIAPTLSYTTLSSIDFDLTGTYTKNALKTNPFKLWYNTSDNLTGATQIGSSVASTCVSSGAGESITMASLSQTINQGATGYFWLTADFECDAIVGRTIAVSAVENDDFTLSTSNITTLNTSYVAGGTQTIIAGTTSDEVIDLEATSNISVSIPVTWTNPYCFDDLMIVISESSISTTPSGSYTANSLSYTDPLNPTLGAGEVIVYTSSSPTYPKTITGLTNGTLYYIKVFTKRGSTWSTGEQVTATPNANYCTATYPDTGDGGDAADPDRITNVTFNTIDNDSGDANYPSGDGYEDFTSVSTEVTQEDTYELSVDFCTAGEFEYHVFAWIDWNLDGDFNDTGESYDLGDVTGPADVDYINTLTKNITVPVDATVGETRMRVIIQDNQNPTPCDTEPEEYGEVEDYTIIVTEGVQNVYNFRSTCSSGSSIDLAWSFPTGVTKVVIVGKEGASPADPRCIDGDNYNGLDNQTYSSAPEYCSGTTTDGVLLYQGTGTSTTITVPTADADYYFIAYSYDGTDWATGNEIIVKASTPEVTNADVTDGNTEVTISWTNPTTGCYDEIMVVGRDGSVVTSTPSGDGTTPAYAANSTFATVGTDANLVAGTEYCVLKADATSVTVTGLTNDEVYHFTIFVRSGSNWSEGIDVIGYPNDGSYPAIITEWSQGESTNNNEWVEILVLRNNLDLRGWELRDVNSTSPDYLLKFKDIPMWEAIPKGTYIILYNPAPIEWGGLPSDDLSGGDCNFQIMIPREDYDSYFLSFVGSDPGDWSWNSGRAISNSTNSDNPRLFNSEGELVHDWDQNNDASFISIRPGSGKAVYYTGTDADGVSSASNWTQVDYDDAALSAGEANTVTQDTWVDEIRPFMDCSYRTVQTNDWDVVATWEATIDGVNWAPAIKTPDWALNGTITVRNTHDVTVTENLAIDQTTVEPTGSIIVNSGIELTIHDDTDDATDLALNGTLNIQGSTAGDGTITFGSGSTFITNNTGGVNGALPTVSTNLGSVTDVNFSFNGTEAQNTGIMMPTTINNLTIENTAGVTLSNDNTAINGILALTSGAFTINSKTVSLNGTLTGSGTITSNVLTVLTIGGTDGAFGTLNFTSGIGNLGHLTINRTGTTPSVNLGSNLIIDNNQEDGNLAITSGSFIVNAGKEVTVKGTLSNAYGATGLILKSDATGTASLLQSSGAVEATVERYLTGGVWHLVFSPLSSVESADYSGYVYSWDESVRDYWNTVTTFGETDIALVQTGWVSESGDLGTTKGYFNKPSSTGIKTLSKASSTLQVVDKQFTVTYNTHTGTIPTSGTDANGIPYTGCLDDWTNYDGWNLIGNPYACAIDWTLADDGTGDLSDIENGIYMWDPSGSNYKYFMNGGTPFTNIAVNADGGISGLNIENIQYIPAGQGFYVKAKSTASGTNNLTIPASARVHTTHDFWKKDEEKQEIANLFRMKIEQNGFTDETVLWTQGGSTVNHDGDFDLYKRFTMDATKPQLYTANPTETNLFALNTFPEIGEGKDVIVGVKIGTAGEHTINFTENTYDNVNIYLEDTYLPKTINVRADDSYSFTENTTGTNTERFILHFNPNNAPVVILTPSDIVVNEDELMSADFSNIFEDTDLLDEFNLSLTKENGEPISWISVNDKTISGTPKNEDVGKFDVILTATDLSGGTTETTFSITVVNVNDAPTANAENIEIYEDTNYQLDFSDIFSDVDAGDELNINIIQIPSWFTVSNDIKSGSLIYDVTPTNDEVGVHTIKMKATDLAGEIAEAEFTVTVVNVNDAPYIANIPENQIVDEDVSFNLDLSNVFDDIDADDNLTVRFTQKPSWISDNNLTISGTPTNDEVGTHLVKMKAVDTRGTFAETEFTITVENVNDAPIVANQPNNIMTDEDENFVFIVSNIFEDIDANDELTIEFVDLPQWLTENENQISGLPTNDEVGNYVISIIATDLSGESASTEFALSVENVNDAPYIANQPENQLADEDELFEMDLSDVFADIDVNDELTIEFAQLPDWLSSDNSIISGTPSDSEFGIYTIIVNATDLAGESVSTEFTITVESINDNPVVANQPENQITNEDEYFEYILIDVFADADVNDELSIEFTQVPEWISVSELTLSGTPTNDEVGIYTVSLSATDIEGATVSTSFEITVLNVNDAPYVANQPENQMINEDEVFSFDFSNVFDDIDFDDVLIYDLDELPEWLSVSGFILSGTPTNEEVGNHNITLSVVDIEGASATTEFEIVVENVNDIPELSIEITDYEGTVGEELSINLGSNTFTDVDEGDVLTYTSDFPTWLSFNPFDLSYIGTPEEQGTYDLTLTATDVAGSSASAMFSVIVSPAVSIVDTEEMDITIYPNPSDGKFVVDCRNINSNSVNIRIIDLTGKTIKEQKDISDDKFVIDLSAYSNGIYYFELISGDKTFKQKLIKF